MKKLANAAVPSVSVSVHVYGPVIIKWELSPGPRGDNGRVAEIETLIKALREKVDALGIGPSTLSELQSHLQSLETEIATHGAQTAEAEGYKKSIRAIVEHAIGAAAADDVTAMVRTMWGTLSGILNW